MNKALKWALVNGSVLAAFLWGYYGEIEALVNISVFIFWVVSIVTLAMIIVLDEVVESTLEKNPDWTPSVPMWLYNLYDVIVTLVLVATGFIWLAVFYLIHAGILSVFADKVQQAQASIETEEPTETS